MIASKKMLVMETIVDLELIHLELILVLVVELKFYRFQD